jgi:hypothetical protein
MSAQLRKLFTIPSLATCKNKEFFK